MAKPKLLIVSQSYAQAENQKKLEALALHFELTCVTPLEVDYIGVRNRLADSPRSPNFKMIGLDTFGKPLSTTKYIYRGLSKVIREHPVDVILVESEPWALVRWQTWLLKRIHQPRVLFGEYSAENLERQGWKGKVLKWAYRLAVASADFVISISEAGAAIYLKNGLRENRLLIAPQLGLDEDFFLPAALEKRLEFRERYSCGRDAFVIGFCGRFVEEKGVMELVEAVESMRQKTGAHHIELVFLGNGPLREYLAEYQKTHAWLKLCPPCTLSEVVSFMQMLDLLVLPSKPLYESGLVAWEEQLGHVLLEAMACGVPCVGSNSGEIPNVIGDARAVFKHGSAEELAGRLTKVFEDAAFRKELAEFQRSRVLKIFTNRALGQRWGDFIKERLVAEQRSILWVDLHLQWRSASVRHLLHALPTLKAAGWEVRAWCSASDVQDEVESVVFRSPRFLPPLEPLWFFLAANTWRLGWKLFRGHPQAAIIHSTGPFYLGADIASVHFIDAIWMRKQMQLGFESWKDFVRWLLTVLNAAADYLQFNHRGVRTFLAVSDSIAREVKARSIISASIEVLPNSFDETRFNLQSRAIHRQALRDELGFRDDQTIFVFASNGHYRRKGLLLAVEALSRLRGQGRKDFRLLIVGGRSQAQAAIHPALSKLSPDWAEWILFAGSQPEIERFFSASDAFLFPSHCESYALVALEASVMGLPLLLTPFHGSEMSLRDGVNGLLLSYDPAEMSLQIAQFLDEGIPDFIPGSGRGLNRSEYAEELLRIYEGLLLRK